VEVDEFDVVALFIFTLGGGTIIVTVEDEGFVSCFGTTEDFIAKGVEVKGEDNDPPSDFRVFLAIGPSDATAFPFPFASASGGGGGRFARASCSSNTCISFSSKDQ